jgi:3'(2'), 5'-bisphosphate nucleotidase
MDLSALLPVAIRAAEEASVRILEVYHSADVRLESKEDLSPLTQADKNAHEAIVAILKHTSIPILSEEGSQIPYEERKTWEYLWIVDPLDGTKEFVKRNGEFTVNIALVHLGKPVLGVISVPVNGDVYYAADGTAFLRRKGKVISLAKQNAIDLSVPGLRVVASRSHMSDETMTFVGNLREPVLSSRGSSLKFMMVAEGLADVYPRFAPTMEWDTAAAHAIVNAIGLKVWQKGFQHELQYNKTDLTNPSFIVG